MGSGEPDDRQRGGGAANDSVEAMVRRTTEEYGKYGGSGDDRGDLRRKQEIVG
jgi:hypothetical protein